MRNLLMFMAISTAAFGCGGVEDDSLDEEGASSIVVADGQARCAISVTRADGTPTNYCPRHPDAFPPSFDNTYNGSDENSETCIRRASDYLGWCMTLANGQRIYTDVTFTALWIPNRTQKPYAIGVASAKEPWSFSTKSNPVAPFVSVY